jgi:hypothetical protein
MAAGLHTRFTSFVQHRKKFFCAKSGRSGPRTGGETDAEHRHRPGEKRNRSRRRQDAHARRGRLGTNTQEGADPTATQLHQARSVLEALVQIIFHAVQDQIGPTFSKADYRLSVIWKDQTSPYSYRWYSEFVVQDQSVRYGLCALVPRRL